MTILKTDGMFVGTTNQIPKDLWPSFGPLLVDRKVIKELGHPIYAEPQDMWWILHREEKVVGFCGLHASKNKLVLCHDYVIESARRKGAYTMMFAARQHHIDQGDILMSEIVTRHGAVMRLVDIYGYQEKSSRGSFVVYRQETA